MKQVIIGYRANGAPIWRLAGSDPEGFSFLIGDDDADDDTDDDDADDTDDDTGDASDSGTASSSTGDDRWPPSREEWEALRDTARRATRQAVERKRALRDAGLPLKPGAKKKKATSDDGDGVDEVLDDRSAAFAEARERAKREQGTERALAKLALKSVLHEQGWSGSDLGIVHRMIDFDSVVVEVGDDGEVTAEGLDEQVEAIRKEVPSWFRKRSRRGAETVGASAVDGGPKPNQPEVRRQGWQKTLSDQLARGRR